MDQRLALSLGRKFGLTLCNAFSMSVNSAQVIHRVGVAQIDGFAENTFCFEPALRKALAVMVQGPRDWSSHPHYRGPRLYGRGRAASALSRAMPAPSSYI